MTDHLVEANLIERLRAGDKSACVECIEMHSPAIYRLSLRLLGDETEAEDVVQETFMNAFKAIDTFEWRSQLNTWLYRIAYNTAMMRLRSGSRHSHLAVDDLLQEEGNVGMVPTQFFDWCCLPERDFETAESRSLLEQAITALPESLRAVFVLRELEGLSTEDAALTLGITPDNVKTRLHRARLWLRERLSPYFTELAQKFAKKEYNRMDHQNCKHLLGHLSEYLDGEASQALCNEIEHHLEGCEDCKVVVDTLHKTVLLYRGMPSPDMPEDARERLYASLNLGDYFKRKSE